MIKKADIPNHIIDTALGLAAEGRWRDLSLVEIAEAAKLPLSQVYAVFPSKQAILAAYERRVDAAVLASEDADTREGPARDRLFDVLMRRFDVLAAHKRAVATIVWDTMRDPLAGLCAVPAFKRSMACMLEAAGLSAEGLRGALRVKALGVAYLATLRVWLNDETEDSSQTMAALDRNLRRLDWLARCASRVRRPGPRGSAGLNGKAA